MRDQRQVAEVAPAAKHQVLAVRSPSEVHDGAVLEPGELAKGSAPERLLPDICRVVRLDERDPVSVWRPTDPDQVGVGVDRGSQLDVGRACAVRQTMTTVLGSVKNRMREPSGETSGALPTWRSLILRGAPPFNGTLNSPGPNAE